MIDWFGLRSSSLLHTVLSTLVWTLLKDTDSVPVFYNSLMSSEGTFFEIWLRIYLISQDSVDFGKTILQSNVVGLFYMEEGKLGYYIQISF